MKEIIKHWGIVESLTTDSCKVRILQSSACSGCSAHQLCRSSESKEKLIEVSGSFSDLTIGQRVIVEGQLSQGIKATYIAYLFPLILMVIALFAGVALYGEATGALIALIVLAIYFAVLSMFKGMIGKSFSFSIKVPNMNNQ